jgi:hypothetical protein
MLLGSRISIQRKQNLHKPCWGVQSINLNIKFTFLTLEFCASTCHLLTRRALHTADEAKYSDSHSAIFSQSLLICSASVVAHGQEAQTQCPSAAWCPIETKVFNIRIYMITVWDRNFLMQTTMGGGGTHKMSTGKKPSNRKFGSTGWLLTTLWPQGLNVQNSKSAKLVQVSHPLKTSW